MTTEEQIAEILKDPDGKQFILAAFNVIETAKVCPEGAKPFVCPMTRNYMNLLIDMKFGLR